MSLKFLVADSLTGKIVGRLYPTAWDWTDPLSGEGAGTLTLATPREDKKIVRLRSQLQPRIRQVVIFDDAKPEEAVFAGPIPRRASYSRADGTISVPVVDWRHWFYQCQLRPIPVDPATDTWDPGDYVQTTAVEQATIMTDLMELALSNSSGLPHLVVDTPPVSGQTQTATFRQLSGSVGDFLDQVRSANVGDGTLDWWTYATLDPNDPTTVVAHVAVGWPERGGVVEPLRMQREAGRGGNVHDYTWPEGIEEPTRVYALGEGEPPAQVWAVDEDPGIDDGDELVWERVDGPYSGVLRRVDAFGYASRSMDDVTGPEGQATLSIAADRIPVAAIRVGDRARVVVKDAWVDVDLPACRIVQKQVTGGRGVPTVQVVTVDLHDNEPPSTDTDPGDEGVGA